MVATRVDPADPVAFDRWFALMDRCDRLGANDEFDGWHPDEIRARSTDHGSGTVWHMVAHEDNGALVAVSWLEVHDRDNTHTLRASLDVDPDLRRRGHGRRAVAEVEHYARQLGRTEIVMAARESAREVGRGPNRAFAPVVGYTLHDESARRDIAWPRPEGELDRLDAAWRPASAGYRIECWQAPSPEAALADLGYLQGIMPVEAPHGELEITAEEWDADRMRAHERRADDMGRDMFVAVAREEASGRLVAFSQLTCSREQPATAYQWDTLVMRAHRGHRLGGLMKVANMRQLVASGMAARRISTFNSVTNTPMIDVNEALGGVLAGAHVEWRKVFRSE